VRIKNANVQANSMGNRRVILLLFMKNSFGHKMMLTLTDNILCEDY